MKIDHILSIPPYISTSWKHVTSLHLEEQSLIITLESGKHITVPGLEGELMEAIFAAHRRYLEKQEKVPLPTGHFSLELFAIDNELPQLPAEVLDKIGQLAQTMGIDDSSFLPHPEADCNCMRCQIAHTLQQTVLSQKAAAEEEEIVSDADLQFSSWRISQQQENLYLVINPLEDAEQYQVHLSNPIGCTCGEKHCEHIRAVLNT